MKLLYLVESRRNGLPQVEQAGNISDLALPPDSGLLEAIHVVFFPNNIVGAEYNHFAPRLSSLANYLHDKSARAIARPIFRSLLRGDSARQLDRLVDLQLFDFSIVPSYVDAVRQRDRSLGDALAANAGLVESPEILQVTLKPQKQTRLGFLARMRDLLRELVDSDAIKPGVNDCKLRANAKTLGG